MVTISETRRLDSCAGNCEVFKPSLRGREVIYLEPFGGLTQLMAGARSFRLDRLKRSDLVSLTEEAANISGIPYIITLYMV